MDLKGSKPLRNKYVILRHGESEANVAGLITSDPAQCIAKYGLTEHGKEQVATTIEKAKTKGLLDADTIIYCSDFKRAVETAELVRAGLGAGGVHRSPALRERFFGNYDGKSVDAYVEIWAHDEQGKRIQQQDGVESPEAMRRRLVKLIHQLESQYEHKCILLVSHGDPLQVLQAAFAGLDPEQSRQLPYIEPAELRELLAITDSQG